METKKCQLKPAKSGSGFSLPGFTLIELLVVLSIVGLLASVALVALNGARQKSRDAKRVADMNQMVKAMELYFDSQNPRSYPIQATYIPLDQVAGLVPTYLSKLPIAPLPSDDPVGAGTCSGAGAGTCPTGNTYCYQGSANTYTMTFCLGGTVAGTGGSGLQAGLRSATPNGIK